MTTYKTPPELAGKDYETWKKEVSLWQSITDLPAEKQAVAITLSVSGQYREVATSINSELLKANNDVENLVTELDKHSSGRALMNPTSAIGNSSIMSEIMMSVCLSTYMSLNVVITS